MPARERAARLLHKMGFSDAAAEACQEIFSSPWDEAEYEFAVKTPVISVFPTTNNDRLSVLVVPIPTPPMTSSEVRFSL